MLHPLIVAQIEHTFRKQMHLQAQGALPLAEMPAWTLSDDNSGLDALLRSQVCIQPIEQHASTTCASYEMYDLCARSTDDFHGNHCNHQRYAGRSEAADRHQLCPNDASGMHDPPLPVAAFIPGIGNPVHQALLW
jgi:hypothetical protein